MSETDSTIDTTEAKPGSADPKATSKIAVIVVHGMGEQRPMDTLWGVVEALWIQDREVGADQQVYPKPDRITGNFELRRITTVKSRLPGEKRVDFFELYWAHLMRDNKVATVWAGVRALLLRPRDRVPPKLIPVWRFARRWTAILLALYALAFALTSFVTLNWADAATWAIAIVAVSWVLRFGFGLVAKGWLGPVAGDAARYLSPDPGNVAARQAIREAAVKLIEDLHRAPEYDRIIVVGHSLGTIVAYDALAFAWGRIDHKELEAAHKSDADTRTALDDLERAATELAGKGPGEGRRAGYRAAQRAYLRRLAAHERSPGHGLWRVSDFVSAGSPLSKADVLMAADRDGWERRRSLRDVPACPPQFEAAGTFSYPAGEPLRVPHHAAVFGPTVWTNVYFETEKVVLGDVIAGPVQELFGPGVLDVRIRRGGARVRHLDYWKEPEIEPNGRPHPWILALRRAVNLVEADEGAAWGGQAEAEEVIADEL